MDAEEKVGIETLLHGAHGLTQQMGLRSCTDADVILLSANPPYIGNGKEQNAAS
jgi:hypothetical protein